MVHEDDGGRGDLEQAKKLVGQPTSSYSGQSQPALTSVGGQRPGLGRRPQKDNGLDSRDGTEPCQLQELSPIITISPTPRAPPTEIK